MDNYNVQPIPIVIPQPLVGIVPIPIPIQHPNLLRAHAHPILHPMPVFYNVPYGQPYIHFMPPYYIAPPMQPMHNLQLQPIYNVARNDQVQQLYNQGRQNIYGVMSPQTASFVPPKVGQKFVPPQKVDQKHVPPPKVGQKIVPLTVVKGMKEFISMVGLPKREPSAFNTVNSSGIQIDPNAAGNNVFFSNGVLYNNAFVTPENGYLPKETKPDDEFDPSKDALPSIYGIRFFNPSYGPEGAIPNSNPMPKSGGAIHKPRPNPRPWIEKQSVPYCKPPDYLANGLPHFQGHYSSLPLHRLKNADFYGKKAQAEALEMLYNNQQLKKQQEYADYAHLERLMEILEDVEEEVETITPDLPVDSSSNVKSKQRRQGRKRSRGFTQSFGIVAHSKRGNQTPNAAAKNVLSLFDKKYVLNTFAILEEKPVEDNNDEDDRPTCSQANFDQNNNVIFNKDT